MYIPPKVKPLCPPEKKPRFEDVPYAEVTLDNGKPYTLKMDIYQTEDQTEPGPCILYIFGGGADFAGGCLVAEPARFAAAALVGGAPSDYAAGARISTHPFLQTVSEGYCRKNREIPCAVWFYGADEAQEQAAKRYFPAGSMLRFFQCRNSMT